MTDSLLPAGPEPRSPSGPGALAWIISLALAAIVGAMLFVGGYLAAGGTAGSATCAAPDEAFAPFCEAYDRLQREYVDDLDPEKLAEGAIRGMFEYGVEDPHSGYMAPEQYEQALGGLSGTISGIGAELSVRNVEDPADLAACAQFSATCQLVVVAPIPDSPAERAGLLPGDSIIAVDGVPVEGTTMTDQIGRIRGEEGTDVTLAIERDGAEPFDLTITRARIEIQEVRTRLLEEGIGYIELNSFSTPAAEQFERGLRSLLDEGADRIVFDLRNNSGGFIESAQRIASQFVGSGLIFTQESAGDSRREYRATGGGLATDAEIPVAVLVNGGSASASEIVAAALQESGRATLIGEPTFGKDTVQVWGRLENNGGVRITVSRWFTAEHRSVAPDGIRPDILVERTPETPPGEDPVLEAAVEFLAAQPAAARESGAITGPTAVSAAPGALPVVVGIVGLPAFC
jgi:carboxyl-terminal processing protease